MENNHIDQQFNEASKLSEEPTVFPGFEKVWEKIEEKLDKKEDKKKIIPLWLPYGIAASLMIGLGAFYFMNKKEIAKPLQPIIAENTSLRGPINKTDIAKIDRSIKENIRKVELPVTVSLPTEPKSSSVAGIDLYQSHPTCNIPSVEASDRVIASQPQIYNDTLKTKEIDEVVVTAYGIKKSYKSVTASSTVMIASTDKTPVHAPAAVSSLAGRVAGLEVSTGIKKNDAILIRGVKSIDSRSTTPLYIVDGIVLGRESGFLNTLDPKKIKELKVLKGLEATALYGSKANNGVVVITTNGLSKDEIEKLKKVSSESKEEILKEPEEPEKVLPKAGQLTAGEVNDFSKWDYWKDIAVPTLDQYKNTWKFFPDKRVSVQLVNQDRKPVIGEKIKLLDDKKNIIWEAVSDNLGNVELWISSMIDENSDSQKYYLSDGSGQIISSNLRTFKNGQNLIILDKHCLQKRVLDLAFVVDATGSMGDEISYLQSELLDVLKKIEGQLKNTTVRYGSVFYRDQGDEYVTRKFDFSDKAEDLVGFIKKQKAGGGGDTPEAVVEALKVSVDELKWSDENSTKIMFLILDAPPHHSEQNIKKLYSTIKAAAKKGITIIPLAASDTDKQTEYLMRTFALLTNGTYTFLTDDSGIGNSHIKPTIDSYEVEKLNDLLLRLILQRAVLPECSAGISNDNINKKMEREIESQIDIKTVLFPNPTKGQLQIKTRKPIEELFIYDLAGKIIMRKEKLPEGKNTIDLTSYPQGIYLVRIHTNDLWETFKVIKN
ncbi:TonB-dependent SusC/RagA subfamily outer membrane receptor [Chryseobacterium vietnamense]|uniref:TonB-dependent SusC/RagA subfamily outer membrane receptor n=1 Tax=Chryseobacterium vietnamense TaxID=866785 RepID=A0ACC6JC80_9FLAO|nr:T9SS type A sorting domain-containing protein [Chryseobacterium vietnamense]MDR6460387.1 TonB-dependent SusC/RagA subfamily outer membrane receptor [Chryseobacterium vietnamense]